MADDTLDVRQSLARLVRWIGTLGGSVVGLGALAFSAGFLAQRAQYDFAQVPFVFIDYWAYAETGVTAFVRSVQLFVASPWTLLAISAATVAVLLAIESARFRAAVLKPHLAFLAYLALVVWMGVVIHQQLAIQKLRNEPLAGGEAADQRQTVPAAWPFRLFLPEPAQPPGIEEILYEGSSIDIWSQIADELELGLSAGARYLEVRPRPDWALVNGETRAEGELSGTVLGVQVRPDGLEAARASRLYQMILSAVVLAIWAFFLFSAWQRRNFEELTRSAPSSEPTDGAWHRSVLRLREEIWFTTQWVARPVAGLLLAIAALFLLPECFGVLALPRLGQELVEVVSERASEDGGSASSVTASGFDEEEMVTKAIELVQNYSTSEGNILEKLRNEWRQQLEKLEAQNTPAAADVLETMANTSAASAPDLAEPAQDVWTRVSARNLARREGYILYYPRSEIDYLRIIQRNPLSRRKRWTIYPIKMSSILELRVKRDEQTIRLIELLRGMRELNPQARAAALLEAEKLGHPRLLEVAIGGTFDPHHHIRGFSITDIGKYAAALSRDPSGTLRRQVALRRLLAIVRDPKERDDLRSTAATSVYLIAGPADSEVCPELVKMLADHSPAFSDEEWQVRGSLATAAGKLRCRKALEPLLAIVTNTAVPEPIRASIPTPLINVGTQADTAPVLARLVKNTTTPAMVVGPALTALSLLEGSDAEIALDALSHFLQNANEHREIVDGKLLSLYRRTALDSLRQLGRPQALPLLERLAQRSSEEDLNIRAKAIMAMGELGLPESEALVLRIFEDRDEQEEVRFACLAALAEFHDNRTVYRLSEMFERESSLMQKGILLFMDERERRGSSSAADEAERLRQKIALTELAGIQPDLGAPPKDLAPQPPRMPTNPAVSSDEEPDLPAVLTEPEVLPLEIGGDPRTDEIDPGQALGYVFEVEEAGGYQIDVAALDEADPAIMLIGPDGEMVGVDDDGGGGLNARLSADLEPGKHVLGVRDMTDGGGTLRVTVRRR